MQTMYDVSAFLGRFDRKSELTETLTQLLNVWQQMDSRGFPDQTLQNEANQLEHTLRSEFSLSPEDIQIISDNEEAFRSHLRHPSRPRTNKEAQP